MNDDFWNELYKDIPIPIQDGEKTTRMMIDELEREIDFHTMRSQIKRWVKEGKLISVGARIVEGKLSQAYKAVK